MDNQYLILLDEEDDTLLGCAKDVNAAEKRIRHRLLPRNTWMLVPYFELFMSCPKDELHQWYNLSWVICSCPRLNL